MLLQIIKRTIYILQQNYEMERLVLLCEYIIQAVCLFTSLLCLFQLHHVHAYIVLHVHYQRSIGDLYIQDLE